MRAGGPLGAEEDEMADRWTEAKDVAMAGFRDPGPAHLNCAQAVISFAAHGFGLDPATVNLARYMGGGSVGMGEMCGAVEGAVLALGMRDYFAPAEHPAIDPAEKEALQGLIRDFSEQYGSATCRGLTGHDISTKEGYDLFKSSPVAQRCDDYVAWVCDHLRSVLKD